jgi:21S rRNA (GM2251-2'-O)-methyltransferase
VGRAPQILSLAERAGVPLKRMSKHDLNMLTDSRPHQGLVLDCSELAWCVPQWSSPQSTAPPLGPTPWRRACDCRFVVV